MKKILIVAIALLSYNKTIAQELSYGIKVGVNLAKFNANYHTPFEYQNILGYQIGGFVEVKLSEKITLQPEILYILQGTKLELNNFITIDPDPLFNSNNITSKSKESNIILPIMLKYYFTPNLNLEFGPQIDYFFNEKLTSNVDDVNSTDTVTSVGGSRSEFNFGLDIGVGYKISNKIGIGLRYNYGFDKFDDKLFETDFKLRNSVFQLNLEYDLTK